MRLHTRIARLEAKQPQPFVYRFTPEESARAREIVARWEQDEERRVIIAEARAELEKRGGVL